MASGIALDRTSAGVVRGFQMDLRKKDAVVDLEEQATAGGKVLILSASDRLMPRVRLTKRTLELHGFQVDTTGRTRMNWSLERFLELPSFYRRVIKICLKKRYNFVHMTHISQIPLMPLLRVMGVRVVYDSLDPFVLDLVERNVPKCIQAFTLQILTSLEDALIRWFCCGVLVTSSAGRHLQLRFGRVCKNVECINNFPLKEVVYLGSLKEKFSRSPLKIAYIGGVHPDKGSAAIIEIAESLHSSGLHFQLNVFGFFGVPRDRLDFIRRAEYMQKEGRLFFHGHLPYEQMQEAIRDHHVGLFLHSRITRFEYKGEGTCRKLFEYLAAGMVVVGNRVGESTELPDKIGAGIFVNGLLGTESIINILKRLDSNRAVAVLMAEKGREYIRTIYNWENESSKVIGVYRRCIR